MIYKIGRDLENNFIVEDLTVSGFHAEIHVMEGCPMFIKDLNSANGTFVNGLEIANKVFNFTDRLVLGSYAINGQKLKEDLTKFVLNNKQDFSKEFRTLKADFDDYEKKTNFIHRNQKMKPLAVRLGLTLGILFLLFKLENIDSNLRYTMMMLTGVLGGVFSGFVFNEGKKKQKLEALEAEYIQKLCCPKCENSLIRKGWEYWRSKGACPKCNCNWENA